MPNVSGTYVTSAKSPDSRMSRAKSSPHGKRSAERCR